MTTKRSVSHATFSIERTYNASPARVFKAFSDPIAKRRWWGAPEDWTNKKLTLDFRIGGIEVSAGGPKGGPMHYYEGRFQDIVENQRIVLTYWMTIDDVRISVTLGTVELEPAGKGTKLTYTEQSAFLDGHDPDGAMRRQDTEQLLDALGRSLAD